MSAVDLGEDRRLVAANSELWGDLQGYKVASADFVGVDKGMKAHGYWLGADRAVHREKGFRKG